MFLYNIAEQPAVNQIVVEGSQEMTDAIDAVYDATVFIEVESRTGGSTGSGFVYEIEGNDAHIITNHHVIDDSTKITVVFSDKTSVEATLVASDAIVDIAVISVPKKSILKVALLGDSDQVKLGNKVVAIGSPLGYDFMNSVTQGYVSGLDRTIDVDVNGDKVPDSKIDLIQIDAAINPGNSGGPLVSSQGQIIGVNTIKNFATGIESMGFSIPINQAKEYADELVEFKKVIRPTFGIGYVDVAAMPPGMIKDLKVDHGIHINQILKDRPADKAGLEPGDVIISVNGVEIYNAIEFTYQLFKYNPGNEIVVEYYREGEKEEITVMLDDSGLN